MTGNYVNLSFTHLLENDVGGCDRYKDSFEPDIPILSSHNLTQDMSQVTKFNLKPAKLVVFGAKKGVTNLTLAINVVLAEKKSFLN